MQSSTIEANRGLRCAGPMKGEVQSKVKPKGKKQGEEGDAWDKNTEKRKSGERSEVWTQGASA